MKFHVTLLCVFVLFLNACSSLRKDAASMLENKEYGEALDLYERLLRENPHDPEATRGRTQARIGLIQKELIEVRMLRLSGQQRSANETLGQVIGKVKSWELYPDGAVAFTQSEEMNYASRAVEVEVNKALQEQRPFRAQFLLQKWGVLFPAERAAALSQISGRTRKMGVELCQGWLSENKSSPFLMRFALKSCAIWQQFDATAPKAKELYAWMEPQFRWLELRADPALETQLRELLQSSFRESPWFEAKAESVALAQIEPRFVFKDERQNVQLTHGYLIQVPYDSTEWVQVTEWVPDDHTTTVTESDGKSRTEVVRGSRAVTRSELQTVTRLRDELRHVPYAATQISVQGSLDFDLRLQASIFDGARKSYSARSDQVLIQHGNNSPQVGLLPSNPKVPVAADIFDVLARKASADFRDELRSLWRREFCRAPREGRWNLVAESVQKCLYGSGGEVPDFAEQWSRRELGLGVVDLRSLVASLETGIQPSVKSMPKPTTVQPTGSGVNAVPNVKIKKPTP